MSGPLPQRKQFKKEKKQMEKEVHKELAKETAKLAVKEVLRKDKQVLKMEKKIKKKAKAKPDGAIRQIMESITMPGGPGNVRYMSGTEGEPSVVAKPFAEFTYPWNQVASTNQNGYNPAFGLVRVTRNPLCAYQYLDFNQANNAYSYKATFRSPYNQLVQAFGPYSLPIATTFHLSPVYWTPTTTYTPHGSTMYAMSVNSASERTYVWLDATVAVTLNVTVTTGAGMLMPYLWDGADDQNGSTYLGGVVMATAGTNNYSFNVVTPGYYGFDIVSNGSATYGYTINSMIFSATGNPVLAHRCAPGFDTNYGAVTACRIRSASILFSSRSGVLVQQGSIVGVQPELGDLWWSCFNATSPFQYFASKVGNETFPSANGCYIYMKPEDSQQLNYRKPFAVNLGVITDSIMRWDDLLSSIVVCCEINSASNARDSMVRIQFDIEYLTMDPWRERLLPKIPLSTLERALADLRKLDQVFENPSHISEIQSYLKKGIPLVKGAIDKYGPTLVAVLQLLGYL